MTDTDKSLEFVHNDKKFDLPRLESIQALGGRYYKSPSTNLWYPSVTTVTGFAKQAFFTEWRKKPENAKNCDSAANRGNILHEIIEQYLNNHPPHKPDEFDFNLFERLIPKLDNINNIQLQEKSLWSDILKMAGRVDCIAEYNGKLSIIDFKGSNKAKQEKWITNYFEQACCYALMYQERTGIKIHQIVILISSDDGTVQEFVKPVKDYLKGLHATVKNYWKQHDFNNIQNSLLYSGNL